MAQTQTNPPQRPSPLRAIDEQVEAYKILRDQQNLERRELREECLESVSELCTTLLFDVRTGVAQVYSNQKKIKEATLVLLGPLLPPLPFPFSLSRKDANPPFAISRCPFPFPLSRFLSPRPHLSFRLHQTNTNTPIYTS